MVFNNANSFTNGQSATLVLGQPSLTTNPNNPNQGQPNPSAITLNQPQGMFFNVAQNSLWVADIQIVDDEGNLVFFLSPGSSSIESVEVNEEVDDDNLLSAAIDIETDGSSLKDPVELCFRPSQNKTLPPLSPPSTNRPAGGCTKVPLSLSVCCFCLFWSKC